MLAVPFLYFVREDGILQWFRTIRLKDKVNIIQTKTNQFMFRTITVSYPNCVLSYQHEPTCHPSCMGERLKTIPSCDCSQEISNWFGVHQGCHSCLLLTINVSRWFTIARHHQTHTVAMRNANFQPENLCGGKDTIHVWGPATFQGKGLLIGDYGGVLGLLVTQCQSLDYEQYLCIYT